MLHAYTMKQGQLLPNAANYRPLTPLGFLEWAATVYPHYTAVIYENAQMNYSQFYERCCRLAGGLHAQDIHAGDVVSVIAPNIPAMLESHYAIPMLAAIINPISPARDAASIAYILEHSETKMVLVDSEYMPLLKDALQLLASAPKIIEIQDTQAKTAKKFSKKTKTLTYEALVESGCANFDWPGPEDEWQTISLNYTMGTVGLPKGVLFHHRGAYLDATGDVLSAGMHHGSVYLWTLPMFRANGWCYSWAVTAIAGTHVCVRDHTDIDHIYALINKHHVTHLSGKRGFLSMLANTDAEISLDYPVHLDVVEGNTDPAVLSKVEKKGFDVTFLYGLTETYGPAAICNWKQPGSAIGAPQNTTDDAQKTLLAHTAAHYPTLDKLEVVDSDTLEPVPADGKSVGEIVVRGNTIFKGYHKDQEATDRAFAGGVFHTGDIGRIHPDGHVEILDRTCPAPTHRVEGLHSVLHEANEIVRSHPSVCEAYVQLLDDGAGRGVQIVAHIVPKPHDTGVTEADILRYCQANLPATTCPTVVKIHDELPKNEDGELRLY